MEMVLILANLLASYHLLLAPGDEKEMGTQVLKIFLDFLSELFCSVPDRVTELPARGS
jgi:hypothetical protein